MKLNMKAVIEKVKIDLSLLSHDQGPCDFCIFESLEGECPPCNDGTTCYEIVSYEIEE